TSPSGRRDGEGPLDQAPLTRQPRSPAETRVVVLSPRGGPPPAHHDAPRPKLRTLRYGRGTDRAQEHRVVCRANHARGGAVPDPRAIVGAGPGLAVQAHDPAARRC